MLRILSGGQTGVDRAALDAARAAGLDRGGWCPRGRRAVDGPIPGCYPLRETPSAGYRQRTEWNVRDSDATLILCLGRLTGGTALTARLAAEHDRPLLVVDLTRTPRPESAERWIRRQAIGILNVAGPRELRDGGVYGLAVRYLNGLFRRFAGAGMGRD